MNPKFPGHAVDETAIIRTEHFLFTSITNAEKTRRLYWFLEIRAIAVLFGERERRWSSWVFPWIRL